MSTANRSELLKNTLTMILAGGQGERLHPLTRNQAKPAVPFGGMYRIIDFTLSNCLNSGLRRLYVLTQYMSSTLDRHLQKGWSIFNPELDEYIFTVPPQFRPATSWYRGTADAIFQNVDLLEKERPEHVLILGGDHVYKMDYSKMIQFHLDQKADLTVACIEVPIKTATELGVMAIDSENRVVGFEEKPEHPKPTPDNPDLALASMGIYIFSTNVLVRRLSEDAKRNTAHDFGKNIIPDMVDSGRVFAYNFKHGNRNDNVYWRDIGLLDAYWEANMDLVSNQPEFNLYDPTWPIRTHTPAYPPSRLHICQKDSSRVVVAQGCIVENAQIENSILSPGVHIGPGSEISDSVLMEGVHIGENVRLHKAIVDEGVHIPSGTQIGIDAASDQKRFSVTDGGVVVIPKGIPIE
ncbi:MAG: glucose-1-phosphate adenylyltransferase [Candidatus Latescibacteria bacterium]|nr:glucose-1-phosphate adenylyltransferase [Candidatus Latescibacterota bacterium]